MRWHATWQRELSVERRQKREQGRRAASQAAHAKCAKTEKTEEEVEAVRLQEGARSWQCIEAG